MEKQAILRAIEASRSRGIFPTNLEPECSLLAGDGSTRCYWRLGLGNESVVMCIDESENRQTMVKNMMGVQKAYQENRVRVPEVYDYDFDLGYILQEDLGDFALSHTLAQVSAPTEEYALYQRILDQLILIHGISAERYEKQAFTQMSFDSEKLMWEVNFTLTHFIQGHLGVELSEKDKNVILESYTGICEKLANAKHVVTHRDFHSRNIMCKGKDLVIIDFQDCRMGIPQYDLVSLLDDCYYKLHPENYARLKRYYWDKFMNQRALQTSWDEFIYLYDMMALQRIFKALGSFGYISKTKNNPKFIRYVGYSFENLRTILYRHSQLSPLRKTLAGLYYGA